MCKRNYNLPGLGLFLLLLLLGFQDKLQKVDAEWIEIPQFSDRDKVYKLPALKLPAHKQSDDRRVFNFQSNQDDNRHGVTFQNDLSLRNISEYPVNQRPIDLIEPLYEGGTLATFTTERTVSTISVEDDDDAALEVVDDVKSQSEEYISQFDKPAYDDSSEEEETTSDSTEIPDPTSKPEKDQYHNDTDHKSFLDYLPIDLLKRVHKTLKSQPATIKGKIKFLKLFERTLLDEIKSRISLALAPTRLPRGARDGEWHDEAIGFPSLEGTLMAISFLTFAVYLVRLVMLLFRNSNGNALAPIFVGRKKRSIDDYSEETARILSYLDTDPL